MASSLQQEIIGHDEVLKQLAHAVKLGYAGFSSEKPLATFLSIGPQSVGKSHTAKALAQFLFATKAAHIRFDMSEFSEGHSISRLIGAPAGYLGHQESGLLTDTLRRRPHALLVFDNIDKAHRDVLYFIKQLLSEGVLTSNKGEVISCKHAIIVLQVHTTQEASSQAQKRFGFASAEKPSESDQRQAILSLVKAQILPEIWELIPHKLVFTPLTKSSRLLLADLLLRELSAHLQTHKNITLQFDESVAHILAAQEDVHLQDALAELIQEPLSDLILRGKMQEKTSACISILNEKLKVVFGE